MIETNLTKKQNYGIAFYFIFTQIHQNAGYNEIEPKTEQ